MLVMKSWTYVVFGKYFVLFSGVGVLDFSMDNRTDIQQHATFAPSCFARTHLHHGLCYRTLKEWLKVEPCQLTFDQGRVFRVHSDEE